MLPDFIGIPQFFMKDSEFYELYNQYKEIFESRPFYDNEKNIPIEKFKDMIRVAIKTNKPILEN